MNANFKKDCEFWAGGKANFIWKVKHYLLFPTFRIITWKRIGESGNSLVRKIAQYKMLKYANKFMITLPIDTQMGGVFLFLTVAR